MSNQSVEIAGRSVRQPRRGNEGWSVERVLAATGGRLVSGNRGVNFRLITTDSRAVNPGDLFLALSGETYHGADFAGQAVAAGAAGLILSSPPSSPATVPVILVPDTLRALGDLAGYHRRRMADLSVLAITGSSGKTTVKEMTAAILTPGRKILATRGNLNNLIGVPLTLLGLETGHTIAVIEMGMNQPGEITRLTEIADPDLACINNVQSAHLAGLGSIEGVARAKGELFQGVRPDACLVVNLDDSLVKRLGVACPQRRITFGRHRRAEVRATRLFSHGPDGISFTLGINGEHRRIRMGCIGTHNVNNALAAAALAFGAGATPDEIIRGLAAFVPYDKRLQVVRGIGGLRLINDTYNANPASMLAALKTLAEVRRERRALVILGDMLELGEASQEAHRVLGETVAHLGFDGLFSCGAFAREMAKAARGGGLAVVKACGDKDEAVAAVRTMLRENFLAPGDWVLVKGSRGLKMETIINQLKEPGLV
ncbi:MAG: UDP-N-acetylmuramoyl-tripeptide--D-alanyl-D-alanine ligase [Proteobacteria bacterium]|nr:UDP-N-acetylmuramoyl-tripeptide--D-alanyl-D-alanine ligase [Pseudomonadota bacterium]MBU1686325.1 UDP-N-acetylmuramoyl-tripeptide--D-alanyl-D-alanine ligase [Pseudomonadota bacterium]